MIHIYATLKGAAMISGIAFLGTIFGAAVDSVDEKTPISVGSAAAVGAVVVLGAWYLSARLQKIDSRLKSIEKTLEEKSRHYKPVGDYE